MEQLAHIIHEGPRRGHKDGINLQPPKRLFHLALAELAAVMRRARLAVTVDTGAMHLAAALGTRTVAIFGPTAPWRTGPFGEGHEVVRLGLECSPCFKRRCLDPRCLTDLPPELAQAACENILSRPLIN